jgi:5-(carboxyamino)imidazole ribonucleotide synthase
MLLPGSWLGVLGGGQLGKMFAVTALTMGYKVVTWDPDPTSPAGEFASLHIQAEYDDTDALTTFSKLARAATTEFENIPEEVLRLLSTHMAVVPGPDAVSVCQDRVREKKFLKNAGFPVPPFYEILKPDDLDRAISQTGTPALLKKNRWGYDGKGQMTVTSLKDALSAYQDFGGVPCILERMIPFTKELSVVLTRDGRGDIRTFPVAENVHRKGVLETTVVPARIPEEIAKDTLSIAQDIAVQLKYQGVLAVEFFLADEGLLVNEMAPRPHNSGHFTLNACLTNQFEQQVRSLCGIPLGDPRLVGPAAMGNIMGDCWSNGEPDWEKVLRHPDVKLHLYGKAEARPGRKMGHFTCMAKDADTALSRVQAILSELNP